jgi:molybdopterin-containing oxidoreductase family iron-sulfur binding subunit
MANSNKIYWKGIEELTNNTEFVKNVEKEFPEYLSVKEKNSTVPSDNIPSNNRRDFLKLLGFSVAAASLAACEAPVKKAIPYLNKPEDIDPTIPNYYASTYYDSNGGYASILVKTREGRPIKIEPNDFAGLMGVTSARVQASVLSLYDSTRLKGPRIGGKNVDWKELDATVKTALASAGEIRIVSSTIFSPTTKKAIAEFVAKYPNTQHIQYDAISVSGLLKANEQSFGSAFVPGYDFSKAEVIVGIACDFLGTWLSSGEYSVQYAETRKLGKNKKKMSRHYQFESNLSLTGSNADYRTPIKPSQEGLVVASLYNLVASGLGQAGISTGELKDIKNLEKAAKDLIAAKGKALVVSGSNDSAVQVLVNGINNMLESYGSTIDINTPLYLKQGDDEKMAAFVEDAKNGKIDAVIFYNANPVYDYPAGVALAGSIKNIKTRISFADRVDETASLCDYIAPDHHFLESWNDAEPKKGFLSLCQPTISPLFKTRQAQESLLVWSGNDKPYHEYLEDNWKSSYYRKAEGFNEFKEFWTYKLHDGMMILPAGETKKAEFKGDVSVAASAIGQRYKANASGLELALYEKISMGNGDQANNPWLQEMPDPVSKACWDNYVTVSIKTAKDLGIIFDYEEDNAIVKVDIGGKSVELPVLVQPGQANGTIGIALGYGREKVGKAGDKVGKNVYPFASLVGSSISYSASDVKISLTGQKRKLAHTQTHNTIMARSVVQGSVLAEYVKNPSAGREFTKIETPAGEKSPQEMSLWKGHAEKYAQNHYWGMTIDLNACNGCGACVVACQAENNIPVVGRQEIINAREMHWIRIDRYYSSDAPEEDKSIGGYRAMEIASENPEVTFQPMLCQHCENAPCETVCPVLATTHSSEGLNQMTYNRCIGTRYCANNCPYKVRRFNWFKYWNNKEMGGYMDDDLGKMVLNPDVTVRGRGVIEKCSMCVQRIQYGKLEAKKQRRKVQDGEIKTACQQSCATGAIVFGDTNDENSVIAKLRAEEEKERNFVVLEDLNVRPRVSYLTKIRNKDAEGHKAEHKETEKHESHS